MRHLRSHLAAAGVLVALSLTGCGLSLRGGQAEAPATPTDETAAEAPRAQTPSPTNQSRNGIRPYDQVITGDVVSREGLFTTHTIGDTLYFEIPRSELGVEMMIMARQEEGGFGNRGNRTVIWEQRGERIDLRTMSYSMLTSENQAISRAVAAIERGNLIASFPIETFGPDSAAVVNVASLFTRNVPEFVQVQGLQTDRTWIEGVNAFPTNVNVTAVQTGANQPSGTPASTVKVTWSIIRLPEDPMMPRLHDTRVGFMSTAHHDYSRAEHRAEERRYIRRFRLEKANPSVELSDPVQPIEFWLDPATPEWLIPWVVQGVEQWIPAFEEAGFSNAIQARMPPDPAEDPDWSMHDARHSMIYWRPSTTQNATGGNVADPRTGEILKAEVNMYHNVMNLLRNWYFVQVSPLDDRARNLPMPDSLMGALVEYVVAHEVGHAIGFPHNFKASAMYPADSIRSRSFLERKGGHVATLMDYSRFNYVAQPEDDIPPELLIPRVGPYDHFAVMWGHRPIPEASSSDEERPVLDEWARMQDTVPWFRFTTPGASNDPHAVTEAVGNADAVQSSTLGMRNLARVVGSLLQVAERPGEDYSLLQELYNNSVSQWGRYNNHVAALIGGSYTQQRYGTGARFEPVSRSEQQAAMGYLAENAFQVPGFFLDQEILRRVESDGAVSRFSSAQEGVFRVLLNQARLDRLIEYEALSNGGYAPYTVADLMGDLRAGVWAELDASSPQVSVFRRSLQRVFVGAMDDYLNPEGERNMTDARPIVRAELSQLAADIEGAASRATDRMTELHLREMHLEVERLLDAR